MLLSILYFLFVTWCFGYSVTFFIKREESFLERFVLDIGLGLCLFSLLIVLFNTLRIKLFWLFFLILALIIPVISVWKKKQQISHFFSHFSFSHIKIKKSDLYLLVVLLLFIVFMSVYLKGAFGYPYLEDDDPWLHAQNARMVSLTQSATLPAGMEKWMYLEPYPPAYSIMMGLLDQMNKSVIETLKFFNVLIIALGNTFFFYLFAGRFFKNNKKAFIATLFLVLIPCFLSHFIWASSLALGIVFIALYCAERASEDKRWIYPSIIAIAALLVSQPSNAYILGIFFFLYWLLKAVLSRTFQKNIFISGALGVTLALIIFWGPVLLRYGVAGLPAGGSLSYVDTGAGDYKAYSFSEFLIAKTSSLMDNPQGIGIFLFILFLISIVYLLLLLIVSKKRFSSEHFHHWVSIAWFLVAFVGLQDVYFHVFKVMPHRWWSIIAIPVVLIAVEGFFALGKFSEKIKIHRFFVYAILILGIVWTSGYPKYVVETSMWPPGVSWGSMDELQGYVSFIKPLPYNTKVFPICSKDSKVLAFDKFAEPWDPEYVKFKASAFNTTAKSMSRWLKSRNYEYLVIDSYCLRIYNQNSTGDKLVEIGNSTYFSYVNGNNGMYLFKVA